MILDINEYQKILERLEDLDDLKTLKTMRSKQLILRRFEGFLFYNATVQHTLLEGCGYR